MSISTFASMLFYLSAACILYTYAIYPIFIAALATVRPRPIRFALTAKPSISIIISVYNEATNIARRLDELTQILASWKASAEIIVICDGSNDATASITKTFTDRGVRLFEHLTNQGKATALNLASQVSRNEILILADARQTWSDSAIDYLLENFSDPEVGAVGGELVLRSSTNVLAGVGLYWRFEKWLRGCESNVHSTIGVSGAICAVRRSLFVPIPFGTILDDMYWPLAVTLQGYRCVHEPRAQAFDRLPDKPSDEFRRKVRTLSGNFQLLQRLPAALNPWKNPVWLQFISHKVLRLVAPWAMILTFCLSTTLDGHIYRLAFWVQAGFLALALPNLLGVRNSRLKIGAVAASFVLLNAAAWWAFWVWIFGFTARTWHKTQYDAAMSGAIGH
jgi:poly-beta-1,6-N-acetyl-D-glucosamine synthase